MQSEDGKGSEKVTARVRDIVTKSLSDNPAEVSTCIYLHNTCTVSLQSQGRVGRLEGWYFDVYM